MNRARHNLRSLRHSQLSLWCVLLYLFATLALPVFHNHSLFPTEPGTSDRAAVSALGTSGHKSLPSGECPACVWGCNLHAPPESPYTVAALPILYSQRPSSDAGRSHTLPRSAPSRAPPLGSRA